MITKILKLFCLTTIISCLTTKNTNQNNFSFTIEDVFQLSSGQLVISGQIKSGEIKKNEKIKILINNIEKSLIIEKMEIFAKPNQSDIGFKNDYIAFTISGLSRTQITKGMIITK